MSNYPILAIAALSCAVLCCSGTSGGSDDDGDAALDAVADSETDVGDSSDDSAPDSAEDIVDDVPADSSNEVDADARDEDTVDAAADADGGLAVPELLQITDLQYAGAFRVPADEFGESSMNYSEGPMALGADGATVFLVGHAHQQAIAEFTIPELVNSNVVTELNMADAPVQSFASVLGRPSDGNTQSIDRVGGMYLVTDASGGSQLLVNAYEYYDAPGDNSHTTLVVRDAADLAESTIDGYYELGGRAHAAGWISPIPSEWQQALGGTHITGSSSGMPIIGRLSVGPSAFVVDPLAITDGTETSGPVPTTALLDFSLDTPLHEDLSNDSGDNGIWTHLSRAIYGFIVPGTRTYLTVGHSGGHATGVCYKCTPVGSDAECGGYCSNDVTDYSHFYWLWDVDDLVSVRNGDIAPHEVAPYDFGELAVPFDTNELGGGAFDPSTGLLYLTVQRADRDQGTYSNPPVIVAYRVP